MAIAEQNDSARQEGNSKSHSRRIQFGVFEVDRSSGELRRSGVKVRIQSQPFRLLMALLDHPGEVVSRETLQQQLWGEATTVDFDHSLGIAVNKLREALGDSAENPRFIETLARRGYRFIAPVRMADEVASAAHEAEPSGVAGRGSGSDGAVSDRPLAVPRWLALPVWLMAVLVAAVLVACLLLLLRPPVHRPYQISQITFTGHVLSNEPDVEGFSAMQEDGKRLYFSDTENGSPVLAVALVANGEVSHIPLPPEIGAPLIGSLSPDGSKLLVHGHLQAEPEQPLWIVPTLGGNIHRVPKVLAHDATWMPGGGSLLVASGYDLVVVGEDGNDAHRLLTVPGLAFWLRWSPDVKRLRFTLQDPGRQTTELWEVNADGSNPHPLLGGWSRAAGACCGSWTPDGKMYLFQSVRAGRSDLWALDNRPWHFGAGEPRQITSGPLYFESPATATEGHRVYFLGENSEIELLQAQAHSPAFNALDENLSSASLVEYSADGQWVAWLNSTDGYLWRSRVDGSERIQLTAPPLRIFTMKWSPDDRQLALMAEEPGRPWKLYLVDSDGGKLTPLVNQDKNQNRNEQDRNEADPNWSADGSTLVFGRLPDRMDGETQPKAIYMLDLATRKMSEVPGSTGLFSPRLSPDGRYIIAIRLDQRALMLFDRTAGRWTTISTHGAGDPIWSRDGRSVYFQDFLEVGKPIYRISVPDGRVERTATINNLRPILASDYRLLSLAPGDLPVVSARTSTVNLYSIDLDER
jgi:DNA-binding winged helix-turn-helix (wHTH) protein/Tol biopolymer transport system component